MYDDCYDVPRFKITLDSQDNILIPILFKGHIKQDGDKFVFTVRRLTEKIRPKTVVKTGEIYFQKIINNSEIYPLQDNDNNIVGCYFFIRGTSDECKKIPLGANVFDIAYKNKDFEWELIPQSPFIVRGVNRID